MILDPTKKHVYIQHEIPYKPVNNRSEWIHYHRDRSMTLGRNSMIVYNRVPKCGSRTILDLFRWMSQNKTFTFKHADVEYRAILRGKLAVRIGFSWGGGKYFCLCFGGTDKKKVEFFFAKYKGCALPPGYIISAAGCPYQMRHHSVHVPITWRIP